MQRHPHSEALSLKDLFKKLALSITSIVIGAGIGFGGSQGTVLISRGHEKDTISSAISAEILANVNYAQQIEGYLSSLKIELDKGQTWTPQDRPIEGGNFIFNKIGEKIGVLDPSVASDVVLFYYYSSALKENIHVLGDGRYMRFELEDKKNWLNQVIELTKKIEAIGNSAVGRLHTSDHEK